MKKIIFLILVTTSMFSQVESNLYGKSWKVGETKVLYNNSITKVIGENKYKNVLNLGYRTCEQIKAEAVKDSENEMWTPEKLKSKIEAFDNFCSGGILTLYIERLTIETANTNNFTVIIKDSDNIEVLREELKSKVANVPSSNSEWSNSKSILIPKLLKGKFSIYVIDKYGGDNSKFMFEITL